jgi:hypothetical protein
MIMIIIIIIINIMVLLWYSVEGLRKTTTKLSHDTRSLRRDLNQEPPEYEAGVLTIRPRRSVGYFLF